MFEKFKSALFERQRRNWERKRRKGKRSFLFYRGVLRWGAIMFVLSSAANVIRRRANFDGQFELDVLIASPLAGYLWSWGMWHVNERRFGYIAKSLKRE